MSHPVLVTGGTGFLGHHLVLALRTSGMPVRVLTRRPDAARELAGAGAEVIPCDVLDHRGLRAHVAGCRAVFHLAGRLFVPGIPAVEYERLHVGSTLALLKACAELEALEWFVLCSTTGVHGPTGTLPAHEDDLGRPQNAYEETKLRAERLATEFARDVRLPLTIARPGMVYGPGDRHLLPLFRAIRGGYFLVIGPGTNHFHPVYIDDVIRGLLLAGERGGRDGRSYHLVGPRPVTSREFADAVGQALGRRVSSVHLPVRLAYTVGSAVELLPLPRRALPLSRSRVLFMTQNRAYDGSRARVELGFRPIVHLDDGMKRTVAWYRQREWL